MRASAWLFRSDPSFVAPVGVDSPPDYLLSENKRYGTLSSFMSQFRTAHQFISPILGKPLLRVGLFVFTMVQASIRFLARGASYTLNGDDLRISKV